MGQREKRIAVIGGGMTGLSAAHYLTEACKREGLSARITLIEADGRLGGKVKTIRRDGFVIEQGPDSFLARKTPIIDLTKELGLLSELVPVNATAGSFIYHRGVLHRMPRGMQLGIPTRIAPFVTTGLISPLGKARGLLDLVLPRGSADRDVALGAFLRRRLGHEVAERIAEPLLSGIYAGNLDELSLMATFPQFRALEQEHRSLILGMAKSRKRGGAPHRHGPELPEGIAGAAFLTYRNGLSSLVEALALRLRDVRILTGESVKRLRWRDNEAVATLAGGEELSFDAAVVTVPNHQVSAMLDGLGGEADLINIPYASVANVVLGFRKSDTAGRRNAGSGFVVARKEGLAITACTVTSEKWPHTAPEDVLLVRCYVGRHGDPRGIEWSDGTMLEAVREDLRRTLGIRAEPLFASITRWPRAMPQYAVGHREKIARFREALKGRMPGVTATGAGFGGVGLPDCIGQGRQAAEQTIAYLSGKGQTGQSIP